LDGVQLREIALTVVVYEVDVDVEVVVVVNQYRKYLGFLKKLRSIYGKFHRLPLERKRSKN
jgi:hypothetical protein